MGLFSGSKIVTVSSVVYNLAGDEIDRPDYLKSLIVRNVLSGTKDSIANTLTNGYLKGPAIKFRSFFRWAQNPDNYGLVGIPTGKITTMASLDPADVSDAISHDLNQDVWVQISEMGNADQSYWAEQWIMDNSPELLDTLWGSDYDEFSNQIKITFADTSFTVFTPVDFDFQSKYVYAYYNLVTKDQEGPVVAGSLVELGEASFPDTTGWTLESQNVTVTEVTLSTGPTSYETGEWVYKRSTYNGGDTDTLTTTVEYMHQFQDASVVDDAIVYDRSYRVDTQENTNRSYGPLKLFIYRVGSGNVAFDALVNEVADYGEFFPFIPLRIANEFLSETNEPDAYAQVKKAYKKATGATLTKLTDQLKDNEDIDDIDNAYVVFGVSLNVVEDACKRYIYRFLEKLQVSQLGGAAFYDEFAAAMAEQKAIADTWIAWKDAQDASLHGGDSDTSTVEPPRPEFPQFPLNEVRINGSGALASKFDMRLEWRFINNGSGAGLGRDGAKVNDCWIEYVGIDELSRTVYLVQADSLSDKEVVYDKIRIYWQKTEDSYTYLEVIGAIHRNYVYGGKAVVINAKDALEDVDESGFIIPLHQETWTEISLVDSTQMATACVFTVFNCYEILKQKWWQSGIFKVLLVIVVAIASVTFTGGAGLGLLGTNFAVGSALGFTGVTAAIVGSVANALAALVLTTILGKLASQLGVIGQVLATLLMIVVGQVATAFQSGNALALNWGDLLRADNLLKLVDSVGRGLTDMLNNDNLSMQQDWMDFAKKAAQETKKIQQAYFDEFGYGAGAIDPFMFVDSTNAPVAESSDTFLTRTLMTGSEIAEMSRDLLYEFPDFSLKLPDAFT